MSSDGKCIIISAPSGAGKTSIVRYLLEQDLGLAFSVSATNRKPRVNEESGTDYHFLSTEEFEERIKNEAFVEWEEVYKGHYYGTLRSEVERIWADGKTVIFDVDVVGGLNLKKFFKEKALAVFVKAPDLTALETRLRSRRTESEEQLAIRLAKAGNEMKSAPEFDVILVNNELSEACHTAQELVTEFLKK
jgi:guanylate kinase